MPVLDNARYEKFVQCLVSGMSQRKSYRAAFKQSKRWKDATVDNKASNLFRNNDEVMARYKELQEQAQDEAIMTRKERMVMLSELAENAEKEETQIKAVDTLNKMDGLYINKTELSGGVNVRNPFAGLSEEELRKLADDSG